MQLRVKRCKLGGAACCEQLPSEAATCLGRLQLSRCRRCQRGASAVRCTSELWGISWGSWAGKEKMCLHDNHLASHSRFRCRTSSEVSRGLLTAPSGREVERLRGLGNTECVLPARKLREPHGAARVRIDPGRGAGQGEAWPAPLHGARLSPHRPRPPGRPGYGALRGRAWPEPQAQGREGRRQPARLLRGAAAGSRRQRISRRRWLRTLDNY
jgi:hypothetical protein